MGEYTQGSTPIQVWKTGLFPTKPGVYIPANLAHYAVPALVEEFSTSRDDSELGKRYRTHGEYDIYPELLALADKLEDRLNAHYGNGQYRWYWQDEIGFGLFPDWDDDVD